MQDPDTAAPAFRGADHSPGTREPGDHECLRCYLMRMLDEFGCDGSHRWAQLWRKARAPRASGLIARLRHQGGFCDCEAVFNAMPDYPEVDGILPCAGVPEGSTGPCDLTAAADRPTRPL